MGNRPKSREAIAELTLDAKAAEVGVIAEQSFAVLAGVAVTAGVDAEHAHALTDVIDRVLLTVFF